ncbi:heterogeneous nuclear ribonucleoprotein Q-like isoform X2 [Ananas comosus]|uniref:Heterogeneous nuclear ribonucleoprotein Q-like isoform X2 n=1 Tax=Ananas comosus TaxID=4615 RepID=A0A6P5FQC8_ANACO|nr:heterogeneous nuclear ribonucleoprotein Q-like isoform X2 [Ananas comosus]
MRTRNSETPKSAAAKKAAAAPKTTPKSGGRSGKGGGGKQATPKSAASAEPNPEQKVEEVPAPSGEKKPAAAAAAMASPAKSPAKKAAGKVKLGTAKAAAKAEEKACEEEAKVEVAVAEEAKVEAVVTEEATEEVKEEEEALKEAGEEESKEEAEEEDKVEEIPEKGTSAHDKNDETENGPSSNEAMDIERLQEMEEEEVDPEEFEEPIEEEVMAEEETKEGEGEEGEGGGGEESAKVEEDEQMEISDMAKRRQLKKEQEIFIGGLDRDAVEGDIRKAFEPIGEVVEVRLHKDFATNRNKGFAFVKFASKEQAARALAELKSPVIRGKRCGIARSEDNDTLFLGNICNTWTKEAIKRKLQDYGIEGVESITLVADTQNEGLSRGFAFLEFSCHADAMLAYKRLQKPDAVFGHPERTAKVAFAEPLREPDPEVMAQVKSVFVDGLPPYWDEDRVKEQFKGYGEIERVVLARNMSTAKRNDFGFVNFTTHEAAVACIEGINDTDLGDDGRSKTKARARLANPLPKTQAVKGGMSGGFRIGYSGGGFNRFGRGFGRGRSFPNRAGFHGNRGFNLHGRGRTGRFIADNSFENSSFNFQGRRPFGFRGGRWGSGSGRRGAFDGGWGRGFPPRRPQFPPQGDFGRHYGATHLGEDPYFYGDFSHGVKRPFSAMEYESSYLQPSRVRPRFDHPDPMLGGSHYRDSLGMGGMYSRDYFGSDYGGSTYSSMYRGEHSGSGYYY